MTDKPKLRSRAWFDDPTNPDMTALYLERYMNFGLSLEELQSGKPIIGIAQTGSDLSPCNRHHIVLAERVREGIREAGGLAIEFPVHPIQETGKRPTAGLDRNLSYMGLVEILYGYPIDGVVLTIGCDKTTPACLMAAATVNIPAIALSVGPMLNGWFKGERTGSGTIVWKAREMMAAGEIDYKGFIKLVASSAPSKDRKPSDILTREAFINAIRVNSAIGGSTNAPIHLNGLARHMGVELSIDDWQTYGRDIPLLVNLMPAGEYLGEDYYHAGGVPAVVAELMGKKLIHENALTVNGKTIGENCRDATIEDDRVIRKFDQPLRENAGFSVLRGNLFDSAIMKLSVISEEFRKRYLSNPQDPDAFEGPVVVFDGPEDYHHRIDDPALGITEHTLLIMRGAGPIGYPGAAEVVNMRAPVDLLKRGIHALPCIGDGRQSGTSGSPSILNASPEAAAGGGLALLKTGDRIRIDLRKGTANMLLSDEELAARRKALAAAGGFKYPESQTPWQEMQRSVQGQMETGMVLEPAVKYQRIAQTKGIPRNNH